MTPYRVTTARLELRCWDPRDAALLHDAVEESRAHLARWLEWARVPAPPPLDQTIALCRRYRGLFDLDQEHHFAVLEAGGGVAGGVALHGGEVGYWIRAGRTGRGYASEAVAAVCAVAMGMLDWERVRARVHGRNEASLGVMRRVGFVMESVEAGSEQLRFGLARPPVVPELRAWDAVGRELRGTRR